MMICKECKNEFDGGKLDFMRICRPCCGKILAQERKLAYLAEQFGVSVEKLTEAINNDPRFPSVEAWLIVWEEQEGGE